MTVRGRTALAGALLLLACGGREEPRGPERIGIVLSWDGVDGARMAHADAAPQGGTRGRAVELRVIGEDATSAAPAITAADSLADDPSVLAVVGHSNSASSLAASQVYNARHLPHIAPTTTSPLFSRAGDYSFRLVPDDTGQAAFLARQIAPGTRRVALVYVNDDYGRALAGGVRRRLAAAARDLVYESPYREGAPMGELADLRTTVAASRPDELLWLGRSVELQRFLDGRRYAVPILAGDGVESALIYQRPDSFPGVRFVRFLDPHADGMRRFGERFQARYRREPTAMAALAYDAVSLIVAAFRAGASTREEVRAYLAAVGRTAPPYRGVSGAVAFDARGDVVRPYLLAETTPAGVRAVTAR